MKKNKKDDSLEVYKSGGRYGALCPNDIYKSGGHYGVISPKDI